MTVLRNEGAPPIRLAYNPFEGRDNMIHFLKDLVDGILARILMIAFAVSPEKNPDPPRKVHPS